MHDAKRVKEYALDSLGGRIGKTVGEEDLGQSLAALGLDSLATLRWRQDIASGTGVELPLPKLTGAVTLSEVMEVLTCWHEDEGGHDTANADVPPESEHLTVSQQAYWSGRGKDFDGGGVATWWYHEYERGRRQRGRWSLDDDLSRVETAWKRILARHEMLRTVVSRDARPVVARYDVRDWSIPRHDLRAMGPDQAEREASVLRERFSHQNRPTDQWPLVDIEAILLPGDKIRLCIGFDALVVDFASWGLVMREWGTLVQRPRTTFAPVATDFVNALAARAHDERRIRRRARDRVWWGQQRLPAAPLGQAVFPEPGLRFRRRRRLLDADTWRAILEEAKRFGISPSSVVLTAFALACHRWGPPEQDGMTINLTVFDRPENLNDVVGDFSGTALLPLTMHDGFDPQSTRTFAELAQNLNRRFWEVLDHCNYSGMEVARERKGEGPWPIVFTSGLGQSSGTDDRWLGERVYGVSQTPQVFWDHLVWEEEGALALTHDVVEGAISDEVVEGVIAMQEALLSSLSSEQGWRCPAPGWDPVVEPSGPGSVLAGSGPLLHDPWLLAVSQYRNRDALLGTDCRISHGELLARAKTLAFKLVEQGCGPGQLVLVALPKGPDQLISVLGVMLAGCGYVPVDPTWPEARLKTIYERTGLTYAIVNDETELPEGMQRIVLSAGESIIRELPRSGADELAYVIFTSGSTGEPKGVAIEHRQARVTIDEINARFEINADDKVLALAAMSFDLSVYDIFGVLGAGGAVVLPEDDRVRDPQHWLELMEQHQVTIWNSAPPMMEMLLEYAESVPGQSRQALSKLRHCFLSGDWIPVTLPDRLRNLAPEVAIHSLGGATEASIWSITYRVGEVDSTWQSIPYGRALPGQSFWILDDKGEPVTVGTSGELYIGGDAVARGYIGADELTSERFFDRDDLNTRLYRTGDLGRWLPDGNIEFLGRIDRQVKIGGHRIELGEVEATLLRLPQVRQAVASSVPGPDGRPRLIAYVSSAGQCWSEVSATQSREIGKDLGQALRNRLPEYMIPGRFILMDKLPTTQNGKIDYGSLPNPFRRDPRPSITGELMQDKATEATGASAVLHATSSRQGGEQSTRVKPSIKPGWRSDSPKSLCAAVLEILGPDIELNSSLAVNGVTSLQMVRLANLVEDWDLPRPTMQALLDSSSIELLIEKWEEAAYSGSDTQSSVTGKRGGQLQKIPTQEIMRALPDLSARLRKIADLLDEAGAEIVEIAPLLDVDWNAPQAPRNSLKSSQYPDQADLTEMQLAYLLGRARDEFGREIAPHFYTEILTQDLDPEVLQDSWNSVLARHPMLRAYVTADTHQRISEQVDASIEVIDQRGLSATEQQRAREVIREERSHRSLPVEHAPTAALLAVRLSDREWRIHFDLDLLFCDAASAVLWITELADLYRTPELELPLPKESFFDWVGCDTPDEEARYYWANALSGLPDPVLPPLEGSGGLSHFVRRRHELNASEWRMVRRKAANKGVTTTCLLLYALGQVLCRQGQGTVMLTLSRRPAGQEGVVGDYTGIVPIAIGSFLGGLAECQLKLSNALEHSLRKGGLHGNAILRMLRSAGRPARIPIAVSCALESSGLDASQLLDCLGCTEYAISQTPQVLLDVQFFDVGGRLICNFDADESILSQSWVDQLFADWVRRLTELYERDSQYDASSSVRLADRVRADIEDIFGQLLGGQLLDDRRSWFDQGATSLTLVSAQRMLRERGYQIDIVDLFAHPTPADIMAHLIGFISRAAEVSAVHQPVIEIQNDNQVQSPALVAARRRAQRRRATRLGAMRPGSES